MSEKKETEKKEAKRGAKLDWSLVERVLASLHVDHVLLWGPPGIGKSYAAYTKGRVERGVYSLVLTPETPASELRGFYQPRGGELVWCDGPAVRAMREGARLVIEELHEASEDTRALLHALLDDRETARLTLPTSETVVPAPGFQVVATANLGPEALTPALRDRFDALLHLTEPHPEGIEQLDERLRAVARRSFALGEERHVSLRGWRVLQKLMGEFGLERACSVVFGPERGPQLHDALALALRG
jgi:MoxR-like ATPase